MEKFDIKKIHSLQDINELKLNLYKKFYRSIILNVSLMILFLLCAIFYNVYFKSQYIEDFDAIFGVVSLISGFTVLVRFQEFSEYRVKYNVKFISKEQCKELLRLKNDYKIVSEYVSNINKEKREITNLEFNAIKLCLKKIETDSTLKSYDEAYKKLYS